MEQKIKEYLRNLYDNYQMDIKSYVDRTYKAKCLGAMETLLVLLGEIKVGVPYDFHKRKREVKILFFWSINIPNTESYEDHILRLTYDVLSKKF